MTDVLLVDRPREGVAVLTLNRPDRLNALTRDLVLEITDSLRELSRDRTLRAIVVKIGRAHV